MTASLRRPPTPVNPVAADDAVGRRSATNGAPHSPRHKDWLLDSAHDKAYTNVSFKNILRSARMPFKMALAIIYSERGHGQYRSIEEGQ